MGTQDANGPCCVEQKVEAIDFITLLRTGRLLEAEMIAKHNSPVVDQSMVTWLDEELVIIRAAVGRLTTPNDTQDKPNLRGSKSGAWKDVDMPDIHTTSSFRWRGDCIEVRTVMELPAEMRHAVAINAELDLNSQWMPFNPKLKAIYSDFSSALITHTAMKIPMLPGTREIYTYRLIVDCFSPSPPLLDDGRQGVLFIDRAPDCWKAGGRFKNEFDIPAPSGYWVTRDEQRLSVALWEPIDEGRARLTISADIVFNVPKWLLPDSAITFLIKTI